MSREFITWARVVERSGVTNNNLPTEWATKAELLQAGAKPGPMENYASTDFVAEEDAVFASPVILAKGASTITGMTFEMIGKSPEGNITFVSHNEKALLEEVQKEVRMFFVIKQPGATIEDFTFKIVSKVTINNVDISTPNVLKIYFNLQNPESLSTHKILIILNPNSTPHTELLINLKIFSPDGTF